jgi:large subunit ribosomal protein L16
LMPKRTKYRKVQTGRMRGIAKGGTRVSFGERATLSTGLPS